MKQKHFVYHVADVINILCDKIFNYFVFKINKINVKSKANINGKIWIKADKKESIYLGNNVLINSGFRYNPIGAGERVTFWTEGKGNIIIGDNVGISNSSFVSQCQIVIDNDVCIGGGTRIYDTDFHSLTKESRVKYSEDMDVKKEKVHIMEGVFIGADTIILKGVSIGKNSVIGAGSVVVNDIPNDEIWAGNPARYLKNVPKKEERSV